jgi:hypothetical protein
VFVGVTGGFSSRAALFVAATTISPSSTTGSRDGFRSVHVDPWNAINVEVVTAGPRSSAEASSVCVAESTRGASFCARGSILWAVISLCAGRGTSSVLGSMEYGGGACSMRTGNILSV